jgi:integrase
MRPDSISQAFERVCKAAGIEGLTFHDLRHEATSGGGRHYGPQDLTDA